MDVCTHIVTDMTLAQGKMGMQIRLDYVFMLCSALLLLLLA